MDADFIDVTKSSKHVVVIFFLVILVIAVLGYFLVFKKYTFSVRTIELELGEALPTEIEDYLTKKVQDPKSYTLDTAGVKVDEVGEYTYTITHNKITRKGKVKVEDTTPPEFTLKTLTIEEGSLDYYLGDFLETCEDASDPCLVTLKNKGDEDKFGKIGTYDIEIEIADLYGNKKTAKGNLNVVEKGSYVDPKSQDLEYASNSKGTEDFKGKTYLKLDAAIKKDSEAAGEKMSEISSIDLEAYVKENYVDVTIKSSEIIELYNKSSYIIGYSIEIVLSDGRTVYVEKSKVSTNTDTDTDKDTEESSETDKDKDKNIDNKKEND